MIKRILAIETSCDETAAAIVEVGERPQVITNIISSQITTHATTGGVIPNVAARMHVEAMPHVLSEATKDKSLDFDAVAVTVGPGLIGSLLVGVNAAKTICATTDKPFFAINHLEGHVYSAWLGDALPELPALILIVSGGHTEIILLERHLHYKYLGRTRDDAAGEAFDKVARLLGLGYPGGPEISKIAEHGDRNAFVFPIGIPERTSCDFSFSGVKAAVRHLVVNSDKITDQVRADIAASFEKTVLSTLRRKLSAALSFNKVRSLCFVGGVSANKYLRNGLSEFAAENDLQFIVPQLEYCTDNAAMIGSAAAFRALFSQPDDWYNTEANPSLDLS